MLIPEEFGALIAELNRDELSYVLIGGVAVNLLGYSRTTQDLDVLVPASPEQGDRIRALLERLGATRMDGSPLPDHLFDGDHHIRALVPLGIIDFVPEEEVPLDYGSVREQAEPDELHGVPCWRVSLADLVTLKRLADRPIDREDLASLEAAYGSLPDSGDLERP